MGRGFAKKERSLGGAEEWSQSEGKRMLETLDSGNGEGAGGNTPTTRLWEPDVEEGKGAG